MEESGLLVGSAAIFIFAISIGISAIITRNFLFLTILLLFAVSGILSWGGNLSILGRCIRYASFFAFIIFAFHLFSHKGRPIFEFWFLQATRDGAVSGFLYAMKLFIFSLTAAIILIGVEPFDLISPIERLSRHIGKSGRYLESFALSMFIGLRFLPEMASSGRMTYMALESRGYSLRSGLFQKARVASLLITPIFVNALKRAELTTSALNVKGYATRYSKAVFPPVRVRIGSVIVLLVSAIAIVAGWRTR